MHFSQRDAVTAQFFDRSSLDRPSRRRQRRSWRACVYEGLSGRPIRCSRRASAHHAHAAAPPSPVERLYAGGASLLPIVCGTDTSGRGHQRADVDDVAREYDGRRMRHVSAREFHQIAGAGRRLLTCRFRASWHPSTRSTPSGERARLSAAQGGRTRRTRGQRAAKKSAS